MVKIVAHEFCHTSLLVKEQSIEVDNHFESSLNNAYLAIIVSLKKKW